MTLNENTSNERLLEARLGRRSLLRVGAGGAAGIAGFAGMTSMALMGRTFAQSCTTAPAQTQGPYWVDEMLNRSDIRSDPATGVVQAGLFMRLGINVSEQQAGGCSPLAGAYVDVWHCNALGVYSDVAAQGTVGQKFLRGYQVTDAHGNVRFVTIYPGWYPGRTIHIHFRIRKFNGAQVTFNFVSQLYFTQSISNAIHQQVAPYNTHGQPNTQNANDGIYSQGGTQLMLRMAWNDDHVIGSFNAVVNSVAGLADARTTPMDPEAHEHLNDFGGGSPPLEFA